MARADGDTSIDNHMCAGDEACFRTCEIGDHRGDILWIAPTFDWLRRIGPAHFSHINFRGTMRFGVEKFAVALIQRAPGQATRMAS